MWVANNSEVFSEGSVGKFRGLTLSVPGGGNGLFHPSSHHDSLFSVFLTSQGQNQVKPTTQSLSKFYVFKADHRARRYFKEMNRDEISDSDDGLTGS